MRQQSQAPGPHQLDNRKTMKASDKAGLEQFLTYRLHILNKLSERGISERYLEKLGVTLPEARVIASVGSFGPFSIMDLARHANLDKSQASSAAAKVARATTAQPARL